MQKMVYLGTNKELFVYTPDIVEQKQLTYPLDEAMGPAIWPVWSPDGKWIAYFQATAEDGASCICIAQVDGMDVLVLAELRERTPLYLHWSPSGKYLACVEQAELLELVVYCIATGKRTVLDDGAPIFFQWLPNQERIVAHIIKPFASTSRIQLYDIEDSEVDYVISTKSGGFASPVFMQDQLLFVEKHQDVSAVQLYNLQSREQTTLCGVAGGVSLQPRPHHNQLAMAVASPNQQAQRSSVQLLDLYTGKLDTIIEETVQSIFWTPNGEKLLYSRVDTENKWLEWKYWHKQQIHTVGQFIPTREQLFFLHFFEQFSLSHNIISADSASFYFSGFEMEHPEKEQRGWSVQAWIIKASLENVVETDRETTHSPFENIAMGLFPSLSW